jgi:hypothetical protein
VVRPLVNTHHHGDHAELDGLALGAAIDLVAAFKDMVAFNGGRPLRCPA